MVNHSGQKRNQRKRTKPKTNLKTIGIGTFKERFIQPTGFDTNHPSRHAALCHPDTVFPLPTSPKRSELLVRAAKTGYSKVYLSDAQRL